MQARIFTIKLLTNFYKRKIIPLPTINGKYVQKCSVGIKIKSCLKKCIDFELYMFIYIRVINIVVSYLH